jgi:hypothetical protein
MDFSFFLTLFSLFSHLKSVKPQENLLQFLMEQTNFLLYNSSYIIEDTVQFLPSYDFIIIGSGSGGECHNESINIRSSSLTHFQVL